jgi:hypothetical protein
LKGGIVALLAACAATASAQLTDYLGPGILTRGASNIGTRSGRDVDLRFFANAMGVYDTGLLPVSVDSNGELIKVDGLYGVEAGLGAYGRHQFRRAVLGLDYRGNYRHYQQNTFFNGSNHQLALGYTLQRSRRLVFDFQGLAGTASFATNFINFLPSVYDSVVDPNTLLFDNRVNYVQGGMDTNVLLNSRTMVTMGGSAYQVHRQSRALIGLNGYNLHGSLQHRLSRVTTLSLNYQHLHFDYPRAFGESDVDILQGAWTRQFGRPWVVSIGGGVYLSEVQGQQRVAVDPAIGRLLGITTTVQTFYRKNTLPAAAASVTYNWRNASWSARYQRSMNPGNGVYLTSRQEMFSTGIAYTGVRRWSFSLDGNHSKMSALGQDLAPFTQSFAGTNVSFALTPAINLAAGYGFRHVDTETNSFRRNSTRTYFSIYFSPGEIPISFR